MNRYIAVLLNCLSLCFLLGCDEKPEQPPSSPPVTQCGTIQGLTCPEKQYCDYGVGVCKIPDAAGTCKQKPEVCTREYNPVCGCDVKTYGNACEAAAAGVSVAHPGECAPPIPQPCGGIAGLACPGGQTCIDDPSDTCDPNQGGADCIGICQAP